MEPQLHPLITADEITRVIHKLIEYHHSSTRGQGSILTLDYTFTENKDLLSQITFSTSLKGLFITDLFGEHLEIESSFGKVSTVDGYPFDVIIGYPPYADWFPKTYPMNENLPVEVLFMYLAFQLLQTEGLLIALADIDRNWPEEQIHKIGELIDTYHLPPAFGELLSQEILVYRKKPTDAVRYE